MISWEEVRRIAFQVARRHHLEPWYDQSANLEDIVQSGIEKLLKYEKKYVMTDEGIEIDEPLLKYIIKRRMLDGVSTTTYRPQRYDRWTPPNSVPLNGYIEDSSENESRIEDKGDSIDEILESRERLFRVMGHLTSEQVKVLFFYGTGYTPTEIAERMNITRTAVNKRIHRARKHVESNRLLEDIDIR